jgi:twitching motility protein PilT
MVLAGIKALMDRTTVDALITGMLEAEDRVSDLLFIAGKPPLIETDGRLTPFAIEDARDSHLTSQFIDALAEQITENNERLLSDYASTGSCDCSYAIEKVARFRVNIYKENDRRAIVMRKLQPDVPTLGGLGLTPIFQEIVKEKNGIILVTGAAGSGKTTTLAALINELNQTQPIHIVTLEDPIEFLHPHICAAISHRELGRDFRSFAEGLRSALRQAPKVILVGEIRDRETMEIAMTAAETGHVVFSTLHTINAGQTINRILGFFTKDDEEQMRYRLSDTVRYIVSQRLVPKISGGRLLISEILGSSLRTRESIRYGESEGKTFHEIIDASTIYGRHSFDHCLLKAIESNDVTEETALLYCNDKGNMRRQLDLQKKLRGQPEPETISTLKLNVTAPATIAPELVPQPIEVGKAPEPTKRPALSNRRVVQPRTPITGE